jgi:hypothetical protein
MPRARVAIVVRERAPANLGSADSLAGTLATCCSLKLARTSSPGWPVTSVTWSRLRSRARRSEFHSCSRSLLAPSAGSRFGWSSRARGDPACRCQPRPPWILWGRSRCRTQVAGCARRALPSPLRSYPARLLPRLCCKAAWFRKARPLRSSGPASVNFLSCPTSPAETQTGRARSHLAQEAAGMRTQIQCLVARLHPVLVGAVTLLPVQYTLASYGVCRHAPPCKMRTVLMRRILTGRAARQRRARELI